MVFLAADFVAVDLLRRRLLRRATFLAGDFFAACLVDFFAVLFLVVLFLAGDDDAALFASVVATMNCLPVDDSATTVRRGAAPSLPDIGQSCIRADHLTDGYCRRVTWTSTNIREVPEPEKMPESGLTSL